jgi:hypothetical protein
MGSGRTLNRRHMTKRNGIAVLACGLTQASLLEPRRTSLPRELAYFLLLLGSGVHDEHGDSLHHENVAVKTS